MNNNMNIPNNQDMNNVNQQPVADQNMVNNVNNQPQVTPAVNNMQQPMPNTNVGMNPLPMNGVPNQAPKKNNTTLIIVIVAILVISVGAFAISNIFISKDEPEKDKEIVDEKDDDKKEEKEDTTTLHAFSEYENYKFTMDIVMSYMGETITTTSTGTADVKNSTDYMVTTATYGTQVGTSYSYSDYKAGYTYTSSDNVNWEAEETEGTESIKLTDIINKINNKDNDVTDLGGGHYSVKVDFETDGTTYDGVFADVYVTNGYITKLSYDLTNLVASSGYTKFTIDFRLTDFNEAGDVVIPASVTNSGATTA